ncbi:MAG: hypothetical protein J2P49_10200 [Methylocapsa sp.]|nr:hypothetical protein [Methylocapsa sp.]
MPNIPDQRKLAAQQRLAEALRENLNRRKLQQRGKKKALAPASQSAVPEENPGPASVSFRADAQLTHN